MPGDEAAFIRSLVRLPESERVGKLAEHLKSFARETPADRAQMVRAMIEAAATLAPEERRSYAMARAAVLANMEMSTQMALVGTYREVLGELSEEQVAPELENLRAVAADLEGREKAVTERLIGYLGENRRREEATSATLARKPWWKFWG